MMVPQGALGLLLLLAGPAAAVRLRQTASRPKEQGPYRQPLQNFQNTQYFGEFEIGGQKLTGIFDTGSFELLVRSTRCDHCKHPTTPYDHAKSSSYKYNGSTVQHVFGSGPCVSVSGYDSVGVGPMSVPHQLFWEITKHKIPVLDVAKFAAIVGIRPHFAPTNDEKTLLMNYGVEEFSICLEQGSGKPGWLSWGPVFSKAEKEKNYVTVPVTGKLHWATKMTGVHFQAGGKTVGKGGDPCANGCAAIIDSGTSLIAAPTKALMSLSEQVGPIAEDCSNLHSLPILKFSLGDKHFELPPHAYVMRMTGAVLEAGDIWDVLFFKPKIKKVNMCMPAFMQLDMMSQQGPVWILGMPFFRYFHTTFNRIDKTMTFANAGPKCKPEPLKVDANGTVTTALISMRRAEDFEPTDVEVESILPPTLSSMLQPHGKDRRVDI